ncbi:MAG TPA: hypothetical protein VFU93_07650 [Acidimicrobiales bacterium]|nr:hypothetical protein [Acidimicrobiales bacterium]
MRRIPLALAAVAITFVLAACDPSPITDPTGAMCPPPVQLCNDTPDTSSEPADAYLVGLTLDELPDDVRIARIGDEHFALTDDYVIGRRTAELDLDADGVARVVKVTVELENGIVTFPEA